MRYPKNFNQVQVNNSSRWQDLDNLAIDDWESLAYCNIKSNDAPSSIVVTNFNFNIPKGSKINTIDIRFNFHKNLAHDNIDIQANGGSAKPDDNTTTTDIAESKIQEKLKAIPNFGFDINGEKIINNNPNGINITNLLQMLRCHYSKALYRCQPLSARNIFQL